MNVLIKRPALLWLVGLGLILSPAYYFFEEAYKLHIAFPQSLLRAPHIFGSIAKLKLVGVIAAPVIGYLVLRVRPISWYAVVVYALYSLGFNLQLFLRAQTFHASRFAFFVGTGLLCLAYFVRQEIRSPYFNPRLRWWERSPRVPVKLRADIFGRSPITCETFDLSPQGCFLMTDQVYTAGENLEFTLTLLDAPISLRGRVMWVSDGGEHPRGIGLRFDRASKEVARALKRMNIAPKPTDPPPA